MRNPIVRQCVVTLLPALLVLAAVVAVAAQGLMSVPEMTRDVAALAHLHPLAGFLSNLGLILWSAAAAVCLFASQRASRQVEMQRLRRFLLLGGVLSAYMLLDDFFQFHEVIAPQFLGLRERYVYLLLALALASYFWSFRDVVAMTRWPVLGLAVALLGASSTLDAAVALLLPKGAITPDWQFALEDGAKWLGIACWCSYFVSASSHALAGHDDGSIERRPAVRLAGLGVRLP